MESNRAVAVATYVEIRRTMARLMEELPKLRKLAQKKVKGLSPEELEARSDLVFALPERIPDGTETAAKKAGEWGTSTSHKNIKFDSSDGNFDSEFFQQNRRIESVQEGVQLCCYFD
ncbi:hypothetical protein FF1_029609 [Malus domestica]|uniref:Uncharacterized protein n=1 Tax=Malus domestica TaxID=3750 RepID=A0A498KAP5_MALDO|nr:hypothetical protein DVH24_038822 [Malus domestica]